MRKGHLLLAMSAALLGGLASAPAATGNTSKTTVELQVPKQVHTTKKRYVQNDVRKGLNRRNHLIGGVYRELNQRQRRKLHRQVPQLRKK